MGNLKDCITNKNPFDYYKAYDVRYKQVHNKKLLWSSTNDTKEVLEAIKKYNISKIQKILEIGCGEGRDAINLLSKGYNILAIDYSKEAIKSCNKLSNNKYKGNFKQFDIIEDKLTEKYDFIYSIAVLHMFVDNIHRNKFLLFINEHLTDSGIALITVMGDGNQEYSSNIENAFKNEKRINMNNNCEMSIASTSCKIVNWNNLIKEAMQNNLVIIDKFISKKIPGFNSSMCIVVKRKIIK